MSLSKYSLMKENVWKQDFCIESQYWKNIVSSIDPDLNKDVVKISFSLIDM